MRGYDERPPGGRDGGRGGQGGAPGTKIYVGNLPTDINKQALSQVFSNYGQVEDVHIMTGRLSAKRAADWYYNSKDANDAILAMAQGYEIRQGDGHIVVRLADGEARSMQLRVSQRTIQRGERVAVAGPEGGKRRRQIEAVLGYLYPGSRHHVVVTVGCHLQQHYMQFTFITCSLSSSEPLSSVTVSSWCRSKPQGEQPQVGSQEDVIAPGALGSFYLQGALAMMRSVGKDPNELIVHRDADVGIYGVRFFKDGRWIYEILDDLLPESEQRQLSSSCNGQEWPALIEKAYAKLHGCYEAVATGAEEDAMEDLLGVSSGRFAVSDFPVWAELWQHLRSKRKRGFALAAIRRREAAGEVL
eukprot:s532_g15.t1